MTTNHNHYLDLAFQLAEKNLGKTGLNPSVGSVIVKENTVISSGVTSISGRPHAEFNSLNKVKNTNVEIIKNLQEQIKKLQKQTMNSLEHITQIFFPSQNNPKYQCECGKVVASRAALVSHKRHCKYLQEIQHNESMET